MTRQRRIAGSAPGTPCMMDPSSLGAPRCLKCGATTNKYDAARALTCAQLFNDVTSCNSNNMPQYDPLCADRASSILKPQYTTYCNATRKGLRHGHRQQTDYTMDRQTHE